MWQCGRQSSGRMESKGGWENGRYGRWEKGREEREKGVGFGV